MALFPHIETTKNSKPKKVVNSVRVQTSSKHQPLAYRLAPKTFDDFVGQVHVLGEGKPLRHLIEQDTLVSLILWGPPGCGKTSLSRLIAAKTKAFYISLNAVTGTVSDIKAAIQQASFYQDQHNRQTILFLDEIHRFNKAQQDALLPEVESGLLTLIGATTENPYFSCIPALISRSQVVEMQPLEPDDLARILEKAILEPEFQDKEITFDDKVKDYMLFQSQGDARKLLNALEMVVNAIPAGTILTQEKAEEIFQQKGTNYNADAHYDIVSAFIKSVRGSDPDAAVYWLARMLKGGEDPAFIARRLIILASEDIGNADPQALVVATSALNAVKFIGMPESQYALAQVTTYLATAPKSNAAAKAIWAANGLIAKGVLHDVPKHLKDSHYKGAKDLGRGKDYKYPHDFPDGYVKQEHMPGDHKLYQPKAIGAEIEINNRMKRLFNASFDSSSR